MADGDGSCFSSEKRGRGQATVHNVRAHAHTRAFNRAVANLVGFGEVSAEEMEGSGEALPSSQPAPDKLEPTGGDFFDCWGGGLRPGSLHPLTPRLSSSVDP